MGFDKKKKIGIIGLASVLLVAMIIGVAVSVSKKNGNDANDAGVFAPSSSISATAKAVTAICAPTDFKKTCEESLASANTTNPKELIRVAFDYTVKNIGDALKNSSLLQEAANDALTKDAFNVCKEVLDTSIEDLKRSFEKVDEINANHIDEYINDVKTWLSGAITNQETCIDAFENTTGDTGEKMKKLLQTASQLSSNGLAIITDFSKILSSLHIGGFGSRRLLSGEDSGQGIIESPETPDGDEQSPSFVDYSARRLMAATPHTMTPNVVVAKDGSGQFKTISDAIKTVPLKNNKTFVIHIKAGVYKETIVIPKKVNNIVLIGDGPTKTIISANKNYANGVQTFHTATLAVNADGFMAKDLTIDNTAGAQGHQAVAARVSSDKAIFYNVHFNGHQDTLYAHTYRQYYRDCTISGTIDFIFGDALAVFQNCRFVVRKPMENQACMITAQGRKDRRSIGTIIIQNGNIEATPEFISTKPAIDAYLGRPWKEYSRTIIMQSNIGGFISPKGWSPWLGTFALNTCYYGEYQNRGPGSSLVKRVRWRGIKKITPQIAQSFTPGVAYAGDEWVKASGLPYNPGMF